MKGNPETDRARSWVFVFVAGLLVTDGLVHGRGAGEWIVRGVFLVWLLLAAFGFFGGGSRVSRWAAAVFIVAQLLGVVVILHRPLWPDGAFLLAASAVALCALLPARGARKARSPP